MVTGGFIGAESRPRQLILRNNALRECGMIGGLEAPRHGNDRVHTKQSSPQRSKPMKRAARILLCLVLTSCAPQAKAGVRLWSSAALENLRSVAETAPREGLPPETAALEELTAFEAAAASPQAGDQVDIAADALFDSLARSFARGATDPRQVDPSWTIATPSAPDIATLHEELASGALPEALLRPLLPRSSEYAALRSEYVRVDAEAPGARDANGFDRETRLERLLVNMERWRWLPRQLADTRIEVRIPAQQVFVFNTNNITSARAVIVGARRTPTPTLQAEVQSVTLNPYWTPPASIVRNELARRFQRDPDAVAREGFEVTDQSGILVDASAVDWSARPFPYLLRQRPGPHNALGRIRFDLPNPYAIYLHDTPNRSVFARVDRALSHGCIRVDDPLGLAAAVLDDPRWTPETLQEVIAAGAERVEMLPRPLAIYILYLTAVVGSDGNVTYYDDLYGRDQRLLAALKAPDAALVAIADPPPRCPA